MEDFKTRLVTEKDELWTRMDKLHNFIISDKIATVSPKQRSLLKIQLSSMNTYYECIVERLNDLA